MRVFVPIEDEFVGSSSGMLVPYRFGLPCEHALREPLQWNESAVLDALDARPVAASPTGGKVARGGLR